MARISTGSWITAITFICHAHLRWAFAIATCSRMRPGPLLLTSRRIGCQCIYIDV